jgi:hypothetical protein
MKEIKSIQVPAQLTRVSSLSDRGLSMGFHTQELPNEEKAIVFNLHNSAGYLLFKPDEPFSEDEVPKQKSNYEAKTPSERLYAVIYVYWKQNKEKEEPIFQAYYERILNGYIEQIKRTLK